MSRGEVRPQLVDHQHFHNHVRPHQSLNMQTLMKCLQSLPMEGQTQSHHVLNEINSLHSLMAWLLSQHSFGDFLWLAERETFDE